MARYDRIARLDPPDPADAYPGWAAVADLGGAERNADLGRRARIWFLVVRALRRFRDRGEALDAASFTRQLNAIREELGQLPTRDEDRRRVADYLNDLAGLDPGTIAQASLEMAASLKLAGHTHAAAEFQRATADLTRARGAS